MKLKHAIIGVAVLAVTALSGPAFATGNGYTVEVGGSTANTSYALSMTSTGTVPWSLQRNAPFTTSFNMNCTSANVAATGSTVSGGTSGGGAPSAIANLRDMKYLGCTTVGGALTVTTNAPVTLHGTSEATSAGTDLVQVHLEGVDITWSKCRVQVPVDR